MIKLFTLSARDSMRHTLGFSTYVPEWAEISDALIQMPGGEWHTRGHSFHGETAVVLYGASADDLVALHVVADAVRRDGGTLSAAIPYLPGARQDRRRHGEALSAKVYADLINAAGCKSVVALDPHSDVIASHVDNLTLLDLPTLVARSLTRDYAGVIVPDAGAGKRASAVAEAMGVPTFQALKKRDPSTGKLSGFSCEPLTSSTPYRSYLVVDDICDGGGTFKGLATTLGLSPSRLDLWVSHGIFSPGAETLSVYFRHVFTTNSFPGPDIPCSTRIDITSHLLGALR